MIGCGYRVGAGNIYRNALGSGGVIPLIVTVGIRYVERYTAAIASKVIYFNIGKLCTQYVNSLKSLATTMQIGQMNRTEVTLPPHNSDVVGTGT